MRAIPLLLAPLLAALAIAAHNATAAQAAAGTVAADFQIKGKRLGASESDACGNAKIENLQESLNATGVTGILHPFTACAVELDSVAGLKPQSPAKLLFAEGRLIRLVVTLDRLQLSEVARLRTAFIEVYGKPTTTRSDSLRTDTWQSPGQHLKIEWSQAMPMDAGIFLTDESGWTQYEQSFARGKKAAEARLNKRRSLDVR